VRQDFRAGRLFAARHSSTSRCGLRDLQQFRIDFGSGEKSIAALVEHRQCGAPCVVAGVRPQPGRIQLRVQPRFTGQRSHQIHVHSTRPVISPQQHRFSAAQCLRLPGIRDRQGLAALAPRPSGLYAPCGPDPGHLRHRLLDSVIRGPWLLHEGCQHVIDAAKPAQQRDAEAAHNDIKILALRPVQLDTEVVQQKGRAENQWYQGADNEQADHAPGNAAAARCGRWHSLAFRNPKRCQCSCHRKPGSRRPC
jgi:hypothetical protein